MILLDVGLYPKSISSLTIERPIVHWLDGMGKDDPR